MKENPFAVLDRKGVDSLMKLAIEKANSTRRNSDGHLW